MRLLYYCEKCCEQMRKPFYKDAENKIGRKSCSRCGDNEPEWFKTELESELDY